MDYTNSDAYVTYAGRRMHQSDQPVPTEVGARDMNMVIWSLMAVVEDGGLLGTDFDPDDAATFQVFRDAIRNLSGVTVIVGDGVTDVSARIVAANTAGKPLAFVGVAHVGSPTGITVPIVDTFKRLFTDTSQVTINNGSPVRPEWFGNTAGNIMRARNALPASGGTIKLANRRYPPSYSTFTAAKGAAGTGVAGVDYLTGSGVRIVGSGMPTPADNFESLVDGTGSIIDGPFFVAGTRCDYLDFGVDSGKGVCDARYGGDARDGFAAVQINRTTPVYWKGGHIDRVIGLCAQPSSAFHAVLIEAGDQFTIGKVYGRRGIHGVVVKSQNWRAELLDGYDCDSNPVILKSDVYAPCNFGQVDRIQGSKSTDSAVRLQAYAATMAGIEIGSVIGKDAPVGLVFDGSLATSSVNIGSVQTHGCPVGIRRANETQGCSIAEAVANNATTSAYQDTSGAATQAFSFGKLAAQACAAGVISNGLVVIDRYISTGTTGYDINYTSNAARVRIGTSARNSPAQANMTNVTPALGAGWANFSGQSSFDVQLDGYGIRLKGLLTPGSVGSTICTLPPQMRPGQNLHFAQMGLNAGTAVGVLVRIDATSGDVTVANHPATIPSGLNLDGIHIPGTFL